MLHDEIGIPLFGCSRIEHLSNVGMVQQCQSLPLGFEAGDDLFGIHARLDDLQRDPALNGPLLLGQIHYRETAFAESAEQFVRANPPAYPFGRTT